MNIRKLKANEIECRVGMIKQNGYSLLLYKDARCDMAILDEIFGWDGWQRVHEFKEGKLYCTIKLWSDRLQQWICKEDVGVESNSEKEKGQASDSFKRACFNLGIGRELYTAPFIWVKGDPKKDKWEVINIEYNENGEISVLDLKSNNGGSYHYSGKGKRTTSVPQKQKTTLNLNDYKDAIERMSELYGRSEKECHEMVLTKLKMKPTDNFTNQKTVDIATEIVKKWNGMKLIKE